MAQHRNRKIRDMNSISDELINVSRYVSYLLRHNPEDLKMDSEGFVDLNQLVAKVRKRFPTADRRLLTTMVNESERRRFEIVENRIRALYGHSLSVHVSLEEDDKIARLYHGTTADAAKQILREGLQPMGRRWVHLSPTVEVALEVGRRRTRDPVILVVDAVDARTFGIKFYRATGLVYVCKQIPARSIKALSS